MKLVLVCLRAARLLVHILYALALACVFPAFGADRKRKTMQRWSVKLLQILHVHLHAQGHHLAAAATGRLLVANHISWLDVFVLNATTPARFVAKSEVGGWPLIGVLVRRTGTLLIRREYRRDSSRINQALGQCLRRGEDVAVFPQGTSTDASQPVHFHSALLQAAIDVGAPVQPVAIVYHDGNAEPLPDVAFTGDMTFVQSLWKMLCLAQIHANAVYLPPCQEPQATRRAVARHAQEAVNARLGLLACEAAPTLLHCHPDSTTSVQANYGQATAS
ncbi:MAG: lysophospholipid acyltransferase family protein [Burkholderiales bacterium]